MHIFLLITLVVLVIVVLAPFHFNVNNLEQTIYSSIDNSSANGGINPGYISASVTVSRAGDLVVITMGI